MTPRTLLAILLTQGSPGQTAFSVEPAVDCASTAPACPDARWSDFYGTWVRKESRETAERRLGLAAKTLVDEARQLLCVAGDGTKLEGCTPYTGAMAGGRIRWSVETLTTAGAAVAQLESGYREDVMVGRGWARKPSNDGGRGRGPGGEGCLMQPHPQSAWRFADVEEELRSRAKAGERAAREEVIQSLLGADEASLRRCWRTGLRMLIHARAYCAWASPETDYDFASFALYGTGTSCTSPNNGKTSLRVGLYRRMVAELRAKKAKAGTAGGKD